MSQFANLVFLERPALAQCFYNDVLMGLSGHYSLDPKWLANVTLGYVGTVGRSLQNNAITETVSNTGKVKLIILAEVKYDVARTSAANTNKFINQLRGILLKLFKDDKKKFEFYESVKPIVAFEVEDKITEKHFYYVTNADFSPENKDRLIRLRKTSTKPDIVST